LYRANSAGGALHIAAGWNTVRQEHNPARLVAAEHLSGQVQRGGKIGDLPVSWGNSSSE
jgi:hypothetical protein